VNNGSITNNVVAQRYELAIDDQLVGYAQYRETDSTVTFIHTEVLPGYAGKGYGGLLAEGAVRDVRTRQKQVLSHCSFIDRYLQSHNGT
jgi:predicted GNAT family acetyltransferase